jgi:hypothetical protein
MKKCVICKQPFTPINSSLEKACPESDCRFKYAMKVVAANRAKKEKSDRKERAKKKVELREATKSKSDYEGELEKHVRKLIRLVDYGCPCVGCGTKETIRWDAGHYHSSGGSRYIRYHALNIWISCYRCNCRKGGNPTGMILNIEKLFGSEVREFVNFRILQTKALHLSIPDLKEKIIEARLLVKEFEAANMALTSPRNSEQRIEMRDYINKRLNIY